MSVNHVVAAGESAVQVLAGARHTLVDPGLMELIMELNGSGSRYGFDEDALHRDTTCRYRPFKRLLEPLHGARSAGGDTLYVRDVDQLAERVRTAPRFRLGSGMEI